jgi:hypothetical protein
MFGLSEAIFQVRMMGALDIREEGRISGPEAGCPGWSPDVRAL